MTKNSRTLLNNSCRTLFLLYSKSSWESAISFVTKIKYFKPIYIIVSFEQIVPELKNHSWLLVLLCEANLYSGITFFFPLKSYRFLPFNHYSLKNPFSLLFYFSFPLSNCFKTLKGMSSPPLLLKDLVDFLLTPLNYTSQHYQGLLTSIMSLLAHRHISHLSFFLTSGFTCSFVF